jgi:NADPH:quinone reductase-like Zn-dependent oxidoreductase
MKAAYLTGVLEPLIVKEIPTPHPGPEDVLIRLTHSALNHRDLWMTKGLYSGPKSDLVMGSDGCGVVEAVGSAADVSLVGLEVIINPGMNWGPDSAAFGKDFTILGNPGPGTFAEYITVNHAYVYPKPAHLSGSEAAALPLAGLTAFRALFTRAKLRAGEKVLVTGIGAGTALHAFQFALAAGADVYVTSGSMEKIEKAKAMGARDGLNYNEADWAEKFKAQMGGFDVIIDSASGKNFERLLDVAAKGGRIAFFGATGGSIGNILPRKIFWNQLSLLGTSMGTQEEFREMVRFVTRHRLKPVVDKVFPSLNHTQDALDYMSKGHQFGKIVLQNRVDMQ